ncbi:hypothetical protein DMT40_29835 [Klebsiella variicola]|nr:hypothetical protein DMT40_29835 [Klebsiella variicola]
MMSLWDALRMNMMISYQELVRTFPNTVVNEMTRMAGDGLINVEHPSGSIDVSLSNTHGQPENIRASVIRTARKILSGMVYLPD